MKTRGSHKRSRPGSSKDDPPAKIHKSEVINPEVEIPTETNKCTCGDNVPGINKINEKNILYMHVEGGTFYAKKNDKTFKTELLQKVCCLRNSNGGLLVTHVKNRDTGFGRNLDRFDERFEKDLNNMIEDDSPYWMNYRRRWLPSTERGEYQDYILLDVEGSSSVSTQDFNTYMPNDGSIVRPKAREIAEYMSKSHKASDTKNESKIGGDEFKEDHTLPYYENRDLQFKRLDKEVLLGSQWKDLPTDKAAVEKILSCRLYNYITTFTKLEKGGVIYFGVEEEKTEPPRENAEGLPTYHYKVRGLSLTENDKRQIKTDLLTSIKQNMLWVDDKGNTLKEEDVAQKVEITFHSTKGDDTSYVIEVLVPQKFAGMVFTKKEGPFACRVSRTGDKKEIIPVDLEKWQERVTEMLTCEKCKKGARQSGEQQQQQQQPQQQ
ncbi:uncharacterized protein LOC124112995 [Haliotis rufescens]|uniref:uncharacterized protein LOC124112995 n=1 Tax=Haliotis rufescens TaxID=6454 RepID=UPI001EAFA22E|nr:uncharacterized protein LOC124112995 [Haliotis rufescens]